MSVMTEPCSQNQQNLRNPSDQSVVEIKAPRDDEHANISDARFSGRPPFHTQTQYRNGSSSFQRLNLYPSFSANCCLELIRVMDVTGGLQSTSGHTPFT